MNTTTAQDGPDQISTGRLIRLTVVRVGRDVVRLVQWFGADRRRLGLAAFVVVYIAASLLWPFGTDIALLLVAVVWWRFRGREWTRFLWTVRGWRRYDAFIGAVFASAGVIPSPTIRRKPSSRRPDVRVTDRSWTLELHAPQGVGKHSAHDLCKLWPQLKNEVGEGCIAVRLHERTGNHVTMVVIWRRDNGERVVRISRDTEIIVHTHRPIASFVENPGLDGWVRPDYAHAAEYHPPSGDESVPTLEPRDEHFVGGRSYTEAIAAMTRPRADDDEDDDEDESDDDPEGTGEPRSAETIWAVPDPLLRPVSDCYPVGGGEGNQTTPPPSAPKPASGVWDAPTGRPVGAGLFAPRPVHPHFRPDGASPGTATGILWDLVSEGHARSTKDLAELAGLTVGTAGNALAKWRALGLVTRQDGVWLPRLRAIAMVPSDEHA